MDGNSIITVLALFLSVYALISEERRKDIAIRLIHGTSLFLIVFLFSIILYFLYWDFFDAQGLHKEFAIISFPKGFDAKYALLTTVILSISFIVILVSRPSRFFINHTSKWTKISNHLLNNGKFEVLSYLLSTYAVDQIKIISRKPCIFVNKKQTALKNQTINICNNNEFIKFLSTSNPDTVKDLILAEINEDIILIFLEEQIKSQYSLFYKGLDEDSGNPAADSFINELITSKYFSSSEQSRNIVEAITRATLTPKDKISINKPFPPYDHNRKENWLHPIRISSNLYQRIYQIALNQEGTFAPNAYDLARIGKTLLESINRSPECDLTDEYPARIDHLLWEVENKYSHLIYEFRNKELSLFHKDIIEAYGYLIRNIILNDNISDSNKFTSLVRAITCCDLDTSIETHVANGIKKDHAGGQTNQAIINKINQLYNQEEKSLKNKDAKNTMAINKIPDLFPQ